MRKCPSCKKAIPVGAKKCVHCRANVADFEMQGESAWEKEAVRHGAAGFGGSIAGGGLNPIDAGSRGYGGRGGRSGSSPGFDRISGASGPVPGALSGGFRRASGGFNAPMSGSYGRASGGYGRASSGFDDAPHSTMLGLRPIASPTGRDFYDDDRGGGGNRVSNTIAGMPGIKFDMTRRQAMEQDPFVEANNSMPTPEALTPVPQPKPLDISLTKEKASAMEDLFAGLSDGASAKTADPDDPFAGLPGVAPKKTANQDDPFAGLPGVAPAPSSLVDETFDDLTAKLFGDDFAAGGNDIGDEEGFDFDFDFAAALEDQQQGTKELEPEVSATAQPAHVDDKETTKADAVEEATVPEKSDAEVESHVAVAAKTQAQTNALIDRVAPIVSIVAAVLTLSWLAVIPKDTPIAFALLASLVAVAVDGLSLKFAPKIKNTGMLMAFLVCVILLFVAMAGFPQGAAAKLLIICGSIAQLICGLIYYSKKY